jgi:hypothetical protein
MEANRQDLPVLPEPRLASHLPDELSEFLRLRNVWRSALTPWFAIVSMTPDGFAGDTLPAAASTKKIIVSAARSRISSTS